MSNVTREEAVKAAERTKLAHENDGDRPGPFAACTSGPCVMARFILFPPPLDAVEFVRRVISKAEYDLNNCWISEADETDLASELSAHLRGDAGEDGKDDPQPIGKCPKCGTVCYTTEGFCGGCVSR